ncbi:MAG: SH3 domain-containing protein, partial [Peptostreptococcaceae bacterium]|nr:SH3 domain-containing protein [Peptostreptococcaceae bacterium]
EPMKNDTRGITIKNSGSTSAYPVLDIGFTQDAHFVQCTDTKGRTVLIGTVPDVDKKQETFDLQTLSDSCEVLTDWTSVGNIIDDGVVDGDLTINGGGYGFTCSNFGANSDGWHGGARRRDLDTELKDFKIEVKMEHNSKGDLNGTGAGTSLPSTSTSSNVKYKIMAEPSLRVRSSRGTSYKQLTSIPKGTIVTVSNIQNNWGKVTYQGCTGYIYMGYTERYVSTSSENKANKYKTTDNLRVRSGRGTSYDTLVTIPKGTTVSVSNISDNWGKVTYQWHTGYCSMKYLEKISTSKATRADEVDDKTVTTEDRMGKIEVYGFDKNGNKLFKMSLKDTSEWYEHTYPEVQIGSKVVLTENSNTPAPKTTKVKDEQDETKTVIKKIDSGAYGNWNEFIGWFSIERKNGKWKCRIEKLNSSGVVTRKIETSTISNSSFPTGELANIVVWFGKYKDNIPVDVMNVSEIYVTNLNKEIEENVNKPLFQSGDSLIIDFSNQTTRLLRKGQTISMMQYLDVGSEFFSVPTGESGIGIKSDDKNINVGASIRKRWL